MLPDVIMTCNQFLFIEPGNGLDARLRWSFLASSIATLIGNGDQIGREHQVPMDCHHEPILLVAPGSISAPPLYDPRIFSDRIL